MTDGSKKSEATSVAVIGSDVYVVGYLNNGTINVATCWINGKPTALSTGTKNTYGNSVAIMK